MTPDFHGYNALVTCIAYMLIGLLMLYGLIPGNEFYSSFSLTMLLYTASFSYVLRQLLENSWIILAQSKSWQTTLHLLGDFMDSSSPRNSDLS
ncbi:hypothetical protein F4678DRAFT_329407 [Xylaria arbuscula]|nr:hypothetical protein F4678DRAFT_329407 [Xylaria arbuscula]